MKTILLALCALSLPAFAADRPEIIEITPGCMFSASAGRCVVENKTGQDLNCTVAIIGQSVAGMTIANSKPVFLPAGRYDDTARVYSREGDTLKSVNATAQCRTIP